MIDIFLDSLIDCLKLLPFLFLSYLFVEYAEHRMSGRTKEWIYRAGKAGPFLGSLIGVIPQCGFSAAASGLFAGGVVSPGTLLAVFLSTSDEMLPIMLSEGISPRIIVKVLLGKVAIGTVAGFLVDAVVGWQRRRALAHGRSRSSERRGEYRKISLRAEGSSGSAPRAEELHSLGMCEDDHCGCEEHGIVWSALYHTVQVGLFIFVVSLVLGFAMEWFGQQSMSSLFGNIPALEKILASAVGLIPNCAASVLITELYLEGVLSTGALFGGLLCGAGAGLLVLFRENRNLKENITITVVLYVIGLIAGLAIGWSGIVL